MRNNRRNAVKKEFLKITGILPLHSTNKLEDRVIRKDTISNLLAEKVFDYPRLLYILLRKIKGWLIVDKTEFTYSLAGHIHYLKQDYRKAMNFFKKAIEQNPPNLDNWFDFAFALYHLSEGEQKLAKSILFEFDLFIKSYTDSKSVKNNLNAFYIASRFKQRRGYLKKIP